MGLTRHRFVRGAVAAAVVGAPAIGRAQPSVKERVPLDEHDTTEFTPVRP